MMVASPERERKKASKDGVGFFSRRYGLMMNRVLMLAPLLSLCRERFLYSKKTSKVSVQE